MKDSSLIPVERIETAIYLIRGEKVMLDRDLAKLYEVTTAALNQAVRRNRERFPSDFMFQLTSAEVVQLNRSQNVIGSQKHRDPRFRPYRFTEQGLAVLSVQSSACNFHYISISRPFIYYARFENERAKKVERLKRHSGREDRESDLRDSRRGGMLDRALAELYDVETRVLNQAVGRNRDRFPADFAFELTREEIMGISQIVTSSNLRFSKRVTAFTEQGVAMLSSVLRSKRAISVNIEIMRAFVRLRRMLASNSDLSRRLDELESKYDRQFKVVFDAIRQLMAPSVPTRKQIGFRARSAKK